MSSVTETSTSALGKQREKLAGARLGSVRSVRNAVQEDFESFVGRTQDTAKDEEVVWA